MNPLDQHLNDVVNRTWNWAERCESFQDHVTNAAFGLAGEAGEVVDVLKKWYFHKEKDRHEELVNEIGDLYYYLAKLQELYGITMEECLAANKAKLFARYEIHAD